MTVEPGSMPGIEAPSAPDPWSLDKPLPPTELQHRTTGASTLTPGGPFHTSGRQTIVDFEVSLAAVGRSLGSFSRVLDFGCGCGRALMWLENLSRTCSLHGVDTDPASISWASENLRFARFEHIRPDPPLPYEDASFDLVVNHSVFTHLDEQYQDRWLPELRRVTRPGGLLILSVHGEHAFTVAGGLQNPGWRAVLETAGILFVADDDNVGGPFPDYYHSTFHAPWYVFSHWGRHFIVRAYLPRRALWFQDHVVLERASADLAIEEPIHPRPAAPAGEPAPPAIPSNRGEHPLEDIAAVIRRQADPDSPTRYGATGRRARRLVMRILRHQTIHQRAVDLALLQGIREAMSGTARDTARLARVEHTLTKQAERIGRLEVDMSRGPRSESADGQGTPPPRG